MILGSRRSGRRLLGGTGASTRWRLTIAIGESARNGMSPVTIW